MSCIINTQTVVACDRGRQEIRNQRERDRVRCVLDQHLSSVVSEPVAQTLDEFRGSVIFPIQRG